MTLNVNIRYGLLLFGILFLLLGYFKVLFPIYANFYYGLGFILFLVAFITEEESPKKKGKDGVSFIDGSSGSDGVDIDGGFGGGGGDGGCSEY